jgi:hypothetical protein
MDIVLSLVVPYVNDPEAAARLRAVSKHTKEAVDACHAELLKSGQWRANVRMYTRLQWELANAQFYAYQDSTHTTVKKSWWRFCF